MEANSEMFLVLLSIKGCPDYKDLLSFPTRSSSILTVSGLPRRLALSPAIKVATSITVRVTLRSEEHTYELQSHSDLVCSLLLEKKNNNVNLHITNIIDTIHSKPGERHNRNTNYIAT